MKNIFFFVSFFYHNIIRYYIIIIIIASWASPGLVLGLLLSLQPATPSVAKKRSSSVFEECSSASVLTVAVAQNCLLRLESTYSEAELQPVGTPGREHKLQVASRLIEEIGTKAASMGG